jgi:hypothetical protein
VVEVLVRDQYRVGTVHGLALRQLAGVDDDHGAVTLQPDAGMPVLDHPHRSGPPLQRPADQTVPRRNRKPYRRVQSAVHTGIALKERSMAFPPIRRSTALLAAALVTALAAVAVLAAALLTQDSDEVGVLPAPAIEAESLDAAKGGGAAPAENPGLGKRGEPPRAAVERPAQPPASPGTRSIISTATLTVRVSDVPAQTAAITGIATGAGGFVAADERSTNGRRSQATLELRVPAEVFGSVLDRIGQLPGATEKRRRLSTSDVTEQVVDVDARIATAQASVDRVRALIARAGTIGEITALESELARREADLESLRARQRKLAGLTAMSTITVTLLGPEAQTDTDDDGFLAGLRGGWAALVTSAGVLVTVLGALLPWLVVLGLPAALVVWALRRRTRRTEST